MQEAGPFGIVGRCHSTTNGMSLLPSKETEEKKSMGCDCGGSESSCIPGEHRLWRGADRWSVPKTAAVARRMSWSIPIKVSVGRGNSWC